MNSDKLLEELRQLEVELHQPKVRSNAGRLGALLHESFVEFGRSGRRYGKAEIIEQLPMENRQDQYGHKIFLSRRSVRESPS